VCDPRGAFGPPTLLAGVNTSFGEYGARLTRDELTVYFSSARPAGVDYNIYVATRASLASAFGPPTLVTAVSSAAGDGYPSLSPDELELFLSRPTTTVPTYDVYVARRASAAVNFGAPTVVAGVNDSMTADLQPFVAANGDLYFESARRQLTGNDVFRAPRMPDGSFGPPAAIEEVATTAVDGTPVLSFDMLTLYWGSQRTDNGGDLSGDIWVAHRASLDVPFSDITRVAELSMAGADDSPTWLSADNCRLYLMSTKGSKLQIYVATRKP